MPNSLKQTMIVWMRAKTGVTAGFLIGTVIAAGAAMSTFIFLCVTGYLWLSVRLGPVFAGLAMAGIFLLIALLAATVSALSRQRTKQRAMIERASLAPKTAILVDPKVLNLAVQIDHRESRHLYACNAMCRRSIACPSLRSAA